jgi:hypothetical protein
MAKDNDLIYGVYDRTRGVGGCDDYFGYFKKINIILQVLTTKINQ